MRTPLIAFLLLAGCGSSLQFTVERYDLDAAPEAREAYERTHPRVSTLGRQMQYLTTFQRSVDDYEAYLMVFNHLVQGLSPVGKGDAKAQAIEETFRPLKERLASEIARIAGLIDSYGASQPAVPLDPALFQDWATLPARLDARNIETEREDLETVTRQLLEQAGPALTSLVEQTKAKLQALPAEGDTRARIDELASDLTEANAVDVVARTQNQLIEARVVTSELSIAMQRISGDLVPRLHEVYQDMADPYLAFVAAHPEHWRQLDNFGSVSGDGDTEFILVFENHLDGRWKYVSVDPTKVIQARLRVARKVAGALTALGGIALKAYGVPLPAGVGGEGAGDTVDYSRMTGEAELAAKRNALRKTQIEEVRAYAVSQLGLLNNANAREIHEQLKRRLAGLTDSSD